jgi:hypothetical protein
MLRFMTKVVNFRITPYNRVLYGTFPDIYLIWGVMRKVSRYLPHLGCYASKIRIIYS